MQRRLWLAWGLAGWAACTGGLEGPSGPMGDDGPGGPGPGEPPDDMQPGPGEPGDGDGDDTEPPANIGTEIFELCNGGPELPGPRLLRLLTRREAQNTLRDLLFLQAPDVSRLPLEARVRGYDNNAEAQAVTARHVDEYLTLAEALAAQAVREQRGQLLHCDPQASDCARRFVVEFGARAFRRPLTEEENARYAAFFASDLTQGDFDEGMRLSIASMLISPNFLYRSEVGEDEGNGRFRLTPYEVASGLSYLYWASMPDQALFDAASRNELSTPAQLEAQARRMLDDQRAKDQLGEFSLQWLRSDNLLSANKDTAVYPAFNESVRTAMVQEQRRFFNRVVFEEQGTLRDLLLADYVLANNELAAFYGLPQPGGDFAMVQTTPESQRGGILGLGAVLAAHAHANESAPIRRGLFVRDRLLCQNLPSPPEDLDTSPPPVDMARTTRERFAQHTSDDACRNCHQFIDGIGFGLEGFDGVGQLRSMENGLPVDASGEIRGIEGLSTGTVDAFEGPRELAELIADSAAARACVSLQYYRFARGYEERRSDACSLAALQTRFEANDLTIKDLLVALPQLESFLVRGVSP